MGLPYSRQINAAFEEVTPLVAAGFKVLQTTRNISIILAVVQILTVFLLFAILLVGIGIMYCVNPDLEHERQYLVTPILRRIASITIFGIIRSLLSTGAVLGVTAYAMWRLFLAKQWLRDVEFEGNVDADKALEEVGDMELDEVESGVKQGEDEGEKKGNGKGKGGKKGKK
ncbi:hypothetical protein FB567DRAFT_581394 [Paraphoma chrysanthemicola]|uniref:Uncharacterized protein n=1 Tax=Paraphoma chrysanthemicola TaxID=798071 RepID=A0A8K0R4L0_9PLEO|nr:hypothetical protein FB567DRAFT_581394 [Paraphoma chrysanthemicola]